MEKGKGEQNENWSEPPRPPGWLPRRIGRGSWPSLMKPSGSGERSALPGRAGAPEIHFGVRATVGRAHRVARDRLPITGFRTVVDLHRHSVGEAGTVGTGATGGGTAMDLVGMLVGGVGDRADRAAGRGAGVVEGIGAGSCGRALPSFPRPSPGHVLPWRRSFAKRSG